MWWIGKNATGPLALNMARLQDPQIDQALNEARGTDDMATRKKDYATLQERQTALLPYIWISKVLWVVGRQQLGAQHHQRDAPRRRSRRHPSTPAPNA